MLFDCKEVKTCQFSFSIPEHPKIFPLGKNKLRECIKEEIGSGIKMRGRS